MKVVSAFFMTTLALAACDNAACDNAADKKAQAQSQAAWNRLELVRVCGRTWIYRDPMDGRLLASESVLSRAWMAADVTPDQACAFAGASR